MAEEAAGGKEGGGGRAAAARRAAAAARRAARGQARRRRRGRQEAPADGKEGGKEGKPAADDAPGKKAPAEDKKAGGGKDGKGGKGDKGGGKKEAKESRGQPTLNLAGAVAAKLEPLKGDENVIGANAVAIKILDKVRAGDNLRDSIQRYVPEGNKLRPWVKAIVEASLEPPTLPRSRRASRCSAASRSPTRRRGGASSRPRTSR